MLKLKISDLLIDSPRFKYPYEGLKPEEGFVVAHTVGWVVEYQGLEYGDFVVTNEENLTNELLKEYAEVMTEQMNDSLKMIIGKEMGWKEFSMSPLLQFSNLHGIKILNK